jgi:hypothetical protein
VQCNGHIQKELGEKSVSGRTPGLNGKISVNLNKTTASLAGTISFKLHIIVLKVETGQFLLKESPYFNCPLAAFQ